MRALRGGERGAGAVALALTAAPAAAQPLPRPLPPGQVCGETDLFGTALPARREAGGCGIAAPVRLARAAGVTLHSARQTIGARSATAEEAVLLTERTGAALLTMQRTAYDDSGRAVEYGTHVYRASRYAFDFRLLVRP